MDELHMNILKYRLEEANIKLKAAKSLLDSGFYKDSIGRSYYAIFDTIRAVLAKDGIDFSKHAGVISYFQKEYIKTEVFDKKYSKIISTAFQIRNQCDYEDFYIAYKEDAEIQYINACELYDVVTEYISKKTN